MGIRNPMNSKGIIEEIIDVYHVRVRIPLLHKISGVVGATPTEELPIACFSTMPNMRLTPQIGDIVIVIFEDNLYSQPIIIGYLYKEDMGESYCDINIGNINVLGNAELPSTTSLGNLSITDIDDSITISKENKRMLDDLDRNIVSSVNTKKGDVTLTTSDLENDSNYLSYELTGEDEGKLFTVKDGELKTCTLESGFKLSTIEYNASLNQYILKNNLNTNGATSISPSHRMTEFMPINTPMLVDMEQTFSNPNNAKLVIGIYSTNTFKSVIAVCNADDYKTVFTNKVCGFPIGTNYIRMSVESDTDTTIVLHTVTPEVRVKIDE